MDPGASSPADHRCSHDIASRTLIPREEPEDREQRRAWLERWYEREAGWDEINEGKDSPVMVQDKDGVSTSKPAEDGIRRG
jgi:hypothetical protein